MVGRLRVMQASEVEVRPAIVAETAVAVAPPGEIVDPLAAVREQAQAILDEAHAQAEAIRVGAQSDAETARKAGREAGYAEGYQDGRRQAIADLGATARTTLEQIEATRREMYVQARSDLALIALEAASVLYGKAYAADEAHAVEVIDGLLGEAAPHRVVTVEVSPEDLPLVLKARARWEAAMPGAAHLQVTADPELSAGSCRVVTDEAGVLERDWPRQLADLASRFAQLEDEPS